MFLVKTYNYLVDHPLWGVAGGFGATTIQFMAVSNDLFKFIGGFLGCVLVGITIYGKVVEIKKNKKG